MNAEQKLKVNMKAAELLGIPTTHSGFDSKYRWSEERGVYTDCTRYCDRCEKWFTLPDSKGHPEFTEQCSVPPVDIFSNPEDCLATLKELGASQDISIEHVQPLFKGTPFESINKWRWVVGGKDIKRYGVLNNSLEDAVADAILELK